MRFADLLLDLAAVASASRSVASKHLELRARQLDRYGQTSSIARSLRGQRKSAPQTGHTDGDAEGRVPLEDSTPVKADPARPGKEVAETGDPVVSAAELKRREGPSLPELKERYGRVAGETRKVAEEISARRQARQILLTQEAEAADTTQQETGVSTDNSQPEGPPQSTATATRVPEDGAEAVEDEIPPDVDINVFRTSLGSSLLRSHQGMTRKLRPKAPPPDPGWFKDYGHDQGKMQGAESTSTPERNQNTESMTGETMPPEPQANSEASVTSGEETIVTQHETPAAAAAEQKHTQMAEEVLKTAEAQSPMTSEARVPPVTHREPAKSVYSLHESKVPATRLSRLWNYGGLAAGMLGGAISEGLTRGLGGKGSGSVFLSPGNMERLVAKLSRMRGAALKLGQMLSFQDSKMLPGPIQEVLQRVQDRADYMPSWQRDRVLKSSLNPEWRSLFREFEEKPIAAASIGQVHRAVLKSGEPVAVKIQFPGVADSINSDLDNLSLLLTASNLLPKGLYLDKTIDNARRELGWECDYIREAECGQRYRQLLADEPDVFDVPEVYTSASGKHVLTMEFMEGVGVTRVRDFTQEQRDWIGTQILRLCLREITEFKFMQTDPNWTNFLYNAASKKLELLDFGASREYPEEFVSQYVSLLAAASRLDRDLVKSLSESLGYLTGMESKTMLDAHITSILTLAEPFLRDAPPVYDFSDQTITERVKALIPVMIRERLAPPPEETYSLHRKLSGAFLLCARLGSRVRCREMFEDALGRARFEVVV